jgi:predicted  nucleic acid-binding Zn-ribbon protein
MKNQRASTVLINADNRLVGLRAIDPNLDFGNDRSVAKFSHQTDLLRQKLAAYNEAVVALEANKNELQDLENQVNKLSGQMLIGVGFEYGQDSHEYELVGGVKTSDRIRKGRITRLKATSGKKSSDNTSVA